MIGSTPAAREAARSSGLGRALDQAVAELACPGCQNNRQRPDECGLCRGEGRNQATIELVKLLTAAACLGLARES